MEHTTQMPYLLLYEHGKVHFTLGSSFVEHLKPKMQQMMKFYPASKGHARTTLDFTGERFGIEECGRIFRNGNWISINFPFERSKSDAITTSIAILIKAIKEYSNLAVLANLFPEKTSLVGSLLIPNKRFKPLVRKNSEYFFDYVAVVMSKSHDMFSIAKRPMSEFSCFINENDKLVLAVGSESLMFCMDEQYMNEQRAYMRTLASDDCLTFLVGIALLNQYYREAEQN